ncbi:MAG: dephospho-CoA kinase, partial [Candidatus Acidiferrales bacterium]
KVGLTGGIASGKSTVASLLRDHDCLVLAADPLGHELLEPGQSAYDEVVREFGNAILTTGDKVDREKLGAIVFSDAKKRERLNQILHPRILDVVRKWFVALDRPGGPEFAVVEAALIIEAGYNKELDSVVVCWCRPDQQLERLKARGLSPQQAEQRIAAQMPVDQKRALANEVIDCSGSFEVTERQVEQLVTKLKQQSASGGNKS